MVRGIVAVMRLCLQHIQVMNWRRVENAGRLATVANAIPTIIKRCNQFIGGVDKLDQFTSYHYIPDILLCSLSVVMPEGRSNHCHNRQTTRCSMDASGVLTSQCGGHRSTQETTRAKLEEACA